MKSAFALGCLAAISMVEPTQAEKTYSYNALTLSWLGEFCEYSSSGSSKCKDGWDDSDIWNGKRFTIHGLWPQYDHPYDGRDPDCVDHDSPYQIDNFDVFELFKDDQQMLDDLKLYWPETGKNQSPGSFYEHEWENHGTCYVMNLIRNNPEYQSEWEADKQAFNKKMAKEYFRTAIDLTKQLNLNSLQEKYQNQQDFTRDIGLGSYNDQKLKLVFRDDNELDEMMVCFTQKVNPGVEQLVQCPEWDLKEYRNSEFSVPDRYKGD